MTRVRQAETNREIFYRLAPPTTADKPGSFTDARFVLISREVSSLTRSQNSPTASSRPQASRRFALPASAP